MWQRPWPTKVLSANHRPSASPGRRELADGNINLILCPVRDSWELWKFPIGNWEFLFFPSGLCPELLDDTNECQYILVHKIHWQLKPYQCNALLSTYIHQNNQKVEKKNLPIRLFFWLVTSLSPFSMYLSKPWISKWDFPHLTSPDGISDWEFGISVILTTLEHHISTPKLSLDCIT